MKVNYYYAMNKTLLHNSAALLLNPTHQATTLDMTVMIALSAVSMMVQSAHSFNLWHSVNFEYTIILYCKSRNMPEFQDIAQNSLIKSMVIRYKFRRNNSGYLFE